LSNLEKDVSEWFRSEFGQANTAVNLSTVFFSRQLDRVSSALASLGNKNSYDILFFTHRPEYFDRSDMDGLSEGAVNSVTFCDNRASLLKLRKTHDIGIVCTHILDEHIAQLIIRSRNLAKVLVAWAWDNHHHEFENLCHCSLADIVVPAHSFCADNLKSPTYILGNSVPLGTGQWSRRFAESQLLSDLDKSRSNSLSGGYIIWEDSARYEHLRKLKREVPGNELVLTEGADRKNYFSQSPAERFQSWSSYKVSIQIPYSGDLSLRVFDSLLTGQIPIVPSDCHDLDLVVPEEIQEQLPIIRVDDLSPSTIEAAADRGIEEFDRLGNSGVLDRHVFARENHHVASRIQQIVRNTADLAKNLNVEIRANKNGVGLVQCK
jgi:hypothetical protein